MEDERVLAIMENIIVVLCILATSALCWMVAL